MTADERHRCGLSPEDYHKLTGFEGDWRDSWWEDDYLSLVASKCNLDTVNHFLDVGCGVGHWGQRLLRFLGPKATMIGVDAETAWTEKAEARAAKLGLSERVKYTVTPAETLPYDDAIFDLVTCQTLLMHVHEPALVIREMIRVLKPGGLFIAAEPNNFATAAAQFVCDPPLPWSQMQDLLELDYFVTAGKRALGEGDSSIGQILPKLLAEGGLTDIHCKLNNNCALKVPPYERPFDKYEYDMMRESNENSTTLSAGGNRQNGLRFFLAAGGSEDRFSYLWKQVIRFESEKLRAMDNNTYFTAGGFLHYFTWGRKPK